MKRVDALLADYAAYHSTKGNVACHFVGIPLIVFGILSMLTAVRLGTLGTPVEWTLAEVLVAAAGLYYLALDVPLALPMIAVSAAFDALARLGSPWIGVAAFIVGWVFQGIGHARYEKKAPAFVRNVVHLLVGPIFLVNEALHLRPVPAAEPART
jgi:uncharacterized membrane protein YGL010W